MKLNLSQKAQLNSNGFLILPDFLSTAELLPLQKWIEGLVDDLAQHLLRQGHISSLYSQKSFLSRLIWIEKEYPAASVCIHSLGLFSQALSDLVLSHKMLTLVRSVLGPDIGLHPVWNIRVKTPGNPLATVPWHQDAAYLLPESEKTPQLTTWLPLVDVTSESGPLVFIKGGHHSGIIHSHRPEKTAGDSRSWYLFIEEKDLPRGDRCTCVVPAGSLILFNQLIPHCCRENHADYIRWSLDLRWQSPRLNNGMGGEKPCLPLTSNSGPLFRKTLMDWGTQKRPGQSPEGYNSEITGPWLDRWSTD